MLDAETNHRLTRVGPGTPLGGLFRQYWLPALTSPELADPDSDPKRIRLLGEDLVVFRDTDGRVGILDEHCAHRRASLVYGRNEDCGLRCLYHGWKYDVDGNVVDMMNEPEFSRFKDRIRIRSYPVREIGGIIWVYMGDGEPPDLPVDRWSKEGASHFHASRVFLDANYLQGLEGGMDSSHAGVLHQSTPGKYPTHPQHRSGLIPLSTVDPAPRLEVETHTFGIRYAAIRKTSDDRSRYLRITTFVFPWFCSIPWPVDVPRMVNGFVPIDDRSSWVWYFWYDEDRELDLDVLLAYSGLNDLDEDFHSPRGMHNQHLQDRGAMRRGDFSGLTGIASEDGAMQESQEKIVDRTLEHLGSSDLAIIRMRSLIADRLELFERKGEVIRDGFDLPLHYEQSVAEVIPAERNWSELVAIPTR